MGKTKLFEISLSKQVAIYFTKECVRGLLTLETEKDIKLSGNFFVYFFMVLIKTVHYEMLLFKVALCTTDPEGSEKNITTLR